MMGFPYFHLNPKEMSRLCRHVNSVALVKPLTFQVIKSMVKRCSQNNQPVSYFDSRCARAGCPDSPAGLSC